MNSRTVFFAGFVCLASAAFSKEIVPAPIQTPWDAKVDPAHVLPDYPRPQLVRADWQNLNGKWDYAITGKKAKTPSDWTGKILVPFCFESELSGVNRIITQEEWMWYRRSFEVSKSWNGQRIWLNFEASDWETVVYVNGKEVGTHRHGYTPFALDVTDALNPSGPQELVVRVWDNSAAGLFTSSGKQGKKQDMYEASSGIWQTVWLEPRPTGAITSLKIRGSLEKATVAVAVSTDGKTPAGTQVKVEVRDGGTVVASGSAAIAGELKVAVPNPKGWEPDHPFLYDVRVSLIKDGQVIDSVESYCGLRDIRIDKTLTGPQIVLNGKAFFHFGPLDQGYWPLSVFTAPTKDALVYELDYLKKIGCNMVRLHIKRNPSRWYYHCDRLGILVWQDFICNKSIKKPDAAASNLWKNEQVMLMDSVNNHPSVVKWIVFNEGWGQHDTEDLVHWAQRLLPDHIVSCASGWNDVDDLGDIRDIHDYSRFPSCPVPSEEPHRAVVIGETGGIGVAVNGNNWLQMPEPTIQNMSGGQVADVDRKGGMTPVNGSADTDFISDIKRPVYSVEGMVPHYARFIETLRLEQAFNLSGAVYTQLTDMRHEQNGWLTFDRKVSKIPVEQMKAIHETLYRPVQARKPLVPVKSIWRDGKGKRTAFPVSVSTEPATYSVEFNVVSAPEKAALNIFMNAEHDRDTLDYLDVYLDGQLIFDDMSRHKKKENRVTCVPLTAGQAELLKPGTHTLKIEVNGTLAIDELDLGLDEVTGE